MKRAQHAEHCRQVIGEPFPEVHDYLDQFADVLGADHRRKLHNVLGVCDCIINWGYLAGAAACLHIWADKVGMIQTAEGKFEPAPIIGG